MPTSTPGPSPGLPGRGCHQPLVPGHEGTSEPLVMRANSTLKPRPRWHQHHNERRRPGPSAGCPSRPLFGCTQVEAQFSSPSLPQGCAPGLGCLQGGSVDPGGTPNSLAGVRAGSCFTSASLASSP